MVLVEHARVADRACGATVFRPIRAFGDANDTALSRPAARKAIRTTRATFDHARERVRFVQFVEFAPKREAVDVITTTANEYATVHAEVAWALTTRPHVYTRNSVTRRPPIAPSDCKRAPQCGHPARPFACGAYRNFRTPL